MTFQTDYTNPINDKTKFETGARMAQRDVSSSSEFGIINSDLTITKLPPLSSNYSYRDRVYAAYSTYSNLRPEFTNSIEVSYQKTFPKNNSLLMSAYYKHTNNLITRYTSTEINPIKNDTVFINTFINANSSFVGGLEFIAKNKVTKWWDVTTNLNLYTSKINTNDPNIQTAGQVYSWFGKINNSFKLPKNFSLQLSGDYTSKTVLAPGGSASSGGGGGGGGRGGFGPSVSGNAQGYSKPTYGVDAAVRYEFLKNKVASFTLSVSDIFKTRKNDVYTQSSYFTQHALRTRDAQFFRLNFALRFGKFDVALFKKKNIRGDQENMQNSMQGVQQ